MRTTATVGITQDPNPPHTRIIRIAAQRVLAREAIAQKQVDVSSRFPARQVFALRMSKTTHHHTLCRCAAAPHNQLGGEFVNVGASFRGGGGSHRLLAPIWGAPPPRGATGGGPVV